ncbi:MAG: efflux RND transporter periplasmic adaptor subunit, partial [Bacteroidota bacterium]
MRKYPIYILLLALLAACSVTTEEVTTIPEDLAGKRELLKAKRTELRELKGFLEELEAAIAEQDPDFAPKSALVTATTIKSSDFNSYATIQATVKANETAFASGELAGQILKLTVDEGDYIRRGQLIATLDVEPIEKQRAELETAIELAKTVYERQERLWNQNIGSEIQYLEAKNNYERLQKSLEGFDTNLAKRNVYAPITGTVDMVNLRAGETAMPGAPIVTILSTNDLKIVADAPEEYLTKFRRGQRVKVNIPTLESSFNANVSQIGKTVDPANRTFEVDVAVPRNQANRLKANLLAEVEVLDAS